MVESHFIQVLGWTDECTSIRTPPTNKKQEMEKQIISRNIPPTHVSSDLILEDPIDAHLFLAPGLLPKIPHHNCNFSIFPPLHCSADLLIASSLPHHWKSILEAEVIEETTWFAGSISIPGNNDLRSLFWERSGCINQQYFRNPSTKKTGNKKTNNTTHSCRL